MKKFNPIIGAVAIAIGMLSADGVTAQTTATSPSSASMSTSDPVQRTAPAAPKMQQLFFTKAAIGGMTEVEAGKLAVDQGSSPEVKAFGQRMVDDHSKIGGQLKDLATRKNVTLPGELDAKHQSMIDALKTLKGPAFDKAFIADMKKGHEAAIKLFTRASKSKDPDIAQFASSTLPTLDDHQKDIPTS